jgi:hypothetical protein
MDMWGAIKSDLMSFVTTITDDTTKTITRVLGDNEEEVVSNFNPTNERCESHYLAFVDIRKKTSACRRSAWQICADHLKLTTQ